MTQSAQGLAPTIGRYTLGRPLGAGGFGTVYLASDPALRRDVAIKILRRRGPKHEVALRREACALARIDHPNVVRVFDVGRCGDHLFVVMEYVSGETLASFLARNPERERALAVMLAAGRGLAAAHAVGLVHCDFKPANVLLGDDGAIKVADFGLARAAQSDSEVATGRDGGSGSDTAGAGGGTPLYMSPEQHRGDRPAPSSDVYSFGLTLLEALQGERVLPATNLAMLYRRKCERRFVDPREIPELAPQLVDALVRALAPCPQQRHADMGQMLRAIERPARRGAAARTMALVAGFGAVLLGADAQPAATQCPSASALIVELAPQHPVLRDALGQRLATDAMAPALAGTIEHLASRHARLWLDGAAQACDAPAPRRAAIDGCLGAELDTFGGVVGALANDDAGAVVHALGELPDPRHCLAADADAASRRSPAVVERLQKARVDELLGDHAALADDVAFLGGQADDDDTSLQADVAYWSAVVARHRGQDAAATAQLERAFGLARGARRDALAHRAAIDLANYTAVVHSDPDGAARWLRAADAVVPDRLDPMAAARRVAADARAAVRAADHQATRRHAHEALAILAAAELGHTPLAFRMGVITAEADLALGELDGFEDRARGLLALARASMGPGTRAVADGHRLLGQYYVAIDRPRDAIVELGLARDLLEARGERMLLAQVHSSLAQTSWALGDIDAAVASYHAAIAVAPEEGVADRGLIHLNLAAALVEAERFEDGEQALDQATALLGATLGTDHPWFGLGEDIRARVLLARGDHDAAAAHARVAAQRFRPTFGDDSWMVADAWLVVADAELGRGDVDAAERALGHADAATDGPSRFVLARDLLRGRVHLQRGRLVEARASSVAARR